MELVGRMPRIYARRSQSRSLGGDLPFLAGALIGAGMLFGAVGGWVIGRRAHAERS